MEEEFKDKKELYHKILPALYVKSKELNRMGFTYIKEKDIWKYMIYNVWNDENISLSEIVSSIINADCLSINNYFMGEKVDG